MSKTQAERPTHTVEPAQAMEAADAPPLSQNVRRHLGQTLRGHYADSLSAPVNERLASLLAQLDKPAG